MKKSKVGVVMHEFKTGSLKSSSGQKVTNPKQGIAIALSEARRANRGGEMASKLFKGKETFKEELAEGKAVAKKRLTPAQFARGEKSEGHKEENAMQIGNKLRSGKMSPQAYAKAEAAEPKGMRLGGKTLVKIKIPINRPTSSRRIPISDKMAAMVPGQPAVNKAYKEGGVVRASKMGKVVSGGNKPHGEHTIQKKGRTQAAQIKMTGSKKMKSGGRII